MHEFVIKIPQQYQTKIGERGVRLSESKTKNWYVGLYHSPKVLILDEATSALDNQTEQVVMDAVGNLSKDITMIIIAHRLNTVKDCDVILNLTKVK